MKKIALVTGITGQDGAYLAELLLGKNYIVYGSYRRSSSSNFWRLEFLKIKDHKNLHLVELDLTDQGSILSLVKKVKPQEIYNLAAQSFVGVSFDQPHLTTLVSGVGALNLLEAIRYTDKDIKFYQASTSEMFGKVQEIPQVETTPFYPRSPYGISKLYAHWMTINYRESYNIFGSCGILFNHESPIRGTEFVTRKITDSLAKIKTGRIKFFEIGNLDAKRDWGYAKDYVDGMWRILQQNKPESFILATNNTNTVRDFLISALDSLGFKYEFNGHGVDEECVDLISGNVICKVSKNFYRPAEVDLLIGDFSKARENLKWSPSTKFEKLVQLMCDADMNRNKRN